MSKITEKLNQLETIVDGVLTPDRQQNHAILVRDIKTILEINANKIIEEIFEEANKGKKYMVVYFMDNGQKLFLDELGNKLTFENGAKVYDNIYLAGNAITRFSLSFPNSKFYIAEKKSEKYVITSIENGVKMYHYGVLYTHKSIKDARVFDSFQDAKNSFALFKFNMPEKEFNIEPITEPCKTKQELQEKMSSLIANGENISSEMHDKWNEFVENC